VTAAGFRSGTVAIVGRPNVGKSTLINELVGAHVSITSRKAQTTRHRILGIRTDAQAQMVFVDTPGFQTRYSNALNRAMNRAVTGTLADVDAIVMVIEASVTITIASTSASVPVTARCMARLRALE